MIKALVVLRWHSTRVLLMDGGTNHPGQASCGTIVKSLGVACRLANKVVEPQEFFSGNKILIILRILKHTSIAVYVS